LRNVEKQNRQQPEKEMRSSKLGRGADPARADDEDDLGENEIAQTERLFERRALFTHVAFCAIE